jgi:hypothetical protein
MFELLPMVPVNVKLGALFFFGLLSLLQLAVSLTFGEQDADPEA